MMQNICYLTVANHNYLEKYNSQVQAWRDIGYECDYLNCGRSLPQILGLKNKLSNYDVIYVRHDFGLDYIWIFLKLFLKKHQKLILEVPTPIAIYLKEIKNYKQSRVKNLATILFTKMMLWSILRRANLVIEFANDSCLVKKHAKIFKWQNGINKPDCYNLTDDYFELQRLQIEKFVIKREFRLIAVAGLAYYHGIDRLIYGIYEYYKNSNYQYRVRLDIISHATEELKQTIDLVKELKLEDVVIFHAAKQVAELKHYYCLANFAVGSLGDHRKGLNQASSIKMREYMYFGLPACIDHYDEDFSNSGYIFTASADDNAINISLIVDFYNRILQIEGMNVTHKIHESVVNTCLWGHKVEKLRLECQKRGIFL